MLTVMDGVVIEKPIKVGNLVIALYVPGTTELRVVPIREAAEHQVESIARLRKWYYRRGKPGEESYEIGVGARVPYDGEFVGPMMVYDHTNPKHVEQYKLRLEELRAGTLRP